MMPKYFLKKNLYISAAAAALAVLLAAFSPAQAEDIYPRQLSVEDCIELALRNNPSLNIREYQLRIEEARIGIAKSEFFPQLSAEGYAERLKDDPFDIGTTDSDDYSRYKEKIKLTQSVYDGGSNIYGLKEAQAEAAGAAYALKSQRQALIYEAKKAYLDVAYSGRVLDAVIEKFESARNYYNIALFEYNEGIISRLRLLEAKDEFLSVMDEISAASSQHEYAVAKLNILLGQDIYYPLNIKDDLEVLIDKPSAYLRQESLVKAYMNRPELFEAESQIEASSMRAKQARAGYHPNLDIEGEYNFTQEDEQFGDYRDWNVKLKVTLPALFDGGKTYAEIKEAKAEIARIESQKQKLKNQITLEVNQACLNVESSYTDYSAAQERLFLAENKYKILQAEKEYGVLSEKELLDYKVQLSGMREDYLSALYRHSLDRITLERVAASSNINVLY